MGTKVVIVLSLLGIAEHSVKSENIVTKTVADNISAESVSRLYRNGPVGVYAGAAPYAAYSFHVPSVIAPNNIPVKEETILVQNTNGFLKDSYGNKYLQTPQALAYRTTFPRQYVQLQNLPAHLSQPLVSPSSQFKQLTPHFFSSSQYNLQGVQALPQTTLSRYTIQQQPHAYGNIQTLAPNSILYNQYQHQAAQPQSTGNKNVYANAPATENSNNIQTDTKFQRLQQGGQGNFHNIDKNPSFQHSAQTDNLQKLQQAPKQTTITTLSNGQKISLNLVTKPPLPLLDLNLLQPLTFANPVVPQVQHYLPRINEETFHKTPNKNVDEVKTHQMEFVVQNTKSYDSEDKPKNNLNKVTQGNDSAEDNESLNPHTAENESSNEGPEFTYEINSPNYKETYTKQKKHYNKETESEPETYNYETKLEGKPIHYSYEKNTNKKPIVVSYERHIEKVPVHHSYEEHTEKKPIHYTYFRTIKEPIHYTTKNSQSPKHLVYTIKPEEQDRFEENKGSRHHTRENSEANSEESDENRKIQDYDDRNKEKNHGHHVRYVESTEDTHQFKPEDKNVQYYHTKNQQDPNIVKHYHVPQLFINHVHKNVAPKQREQEHFQPVLPEYEENTKHFHKGNDKIRVDPNQHIQSSRNSPPPQNHPVTYEYIRSHYSAAPIVKGNPKPAQNEPAEEEKEPEGTYKTQENSEENFEKSYKDAAYGFAAYDSPHDDSERDIYNPESYGAPRYYSEYNIDKSPFKQYESEGDDFPKTTRSNYKDERDKIHEDYFLDYAVSKPTSLRDSFRHKESYYKMFKNNKPESYYHNEDDVKKQNAKYTVPTYEFYAPKQRHHGANQKSNPHVYEHNYSSDEPRDASAYATRPLHRYKSKTQFVEPQFQYGFEPISLPQLLDSELAAMASNNNPKTEKQGTRKKIYKENVYIKKTSTKGGKKISR
ncbi:uncharacterized protein LOC110995007 [Pieris rapae]|uniref:uncharacterized protein LOC110995007 n=1 Tax=Pieris rapae TaxID=64459 RepID=UPI001E27B385|nr:uncharacterized protein LOC110995007 [Pieris rapae]